MSGVSLQLSSSLCAGAPEAWLWQHAALSEAAQQYAWPAAVKQSHSSLAPEQPVSSHHTARFLLCVKGQPTAEQAPFAPSRPGQIDK